MSARNRSAGAQAVHQKGLAVETPETVDFEKVKPVKEVLSGRGLESAIHGYVPYQDDVKFKKGEAEILQAGAYKIIRCSYGPVGNGVVAFWYWVDSIPPQWAGDRPADPPKSSAISARCLAK